MTVTTPRRRYLILRRTKPPIDVTGTEYATRTEQVWEGTDVLDFTVGAATIAPGMHVKFVATGDWVIDGKTIPGAMIAVEETPPGGAQEAFDTWLGSIGRNPLLAHREDPDNIFAAGYRAGKENPRHLPLIRELVMNYHLNLLGAESAMDALVALLL